MNIDAHFHLHYTIPTESDLILRAVKKLDKIKEDNSLEKILSIIPIENSEILETLRKKYNYLYPGVYVLVEKYNQRLMEEVKNFDFVKINNWLGMPFSLHQELEKLLLDSISNGIKKFQIHVSYLDEEKLNLIEKYIKNFDVIFHLPHGVYAIYHYSSKVDLNRLKRLEGNLLLGTSPYWGIIAEIPNRSLTKAVKDGLEDMIAFESDFILNYEDTFYPYTIRSVTKSVEETKVCEKILYENVKLFLE